MLKKKKKELLRFNICEINFYIIKIFEKYFFKDSETLRENR